MSRWFRYYDDALNDPKVQTLPGDLFKLWVNLLCVASKRGGQLPVIYQLTYMLRRRSDRLERDFNTLVKLGLIDLVDDHFEPHNWRKRQYKSDNSTERSQRHRASKCNVAETLQKRPQITDTESEQKSSLSEPRSDARRRISYSEEFDGFWKSYPTDSLMSKKQAFDAWKRLSPEDRAKAHSAVPAFVEYCKKNPDYRPIHAVRFLTQRRFDGFAKTDLDREAERKIEADMAARGYVWRDGKWEKSEAA